MTCAAVEAVAAVAVAVAVTVAPPPSTTAAPARQTITPAELLGDAWSGGLIANAAFIPAPGARQAQAPFRGTLRLLEAPMIIKPRDLRIKSVLGLDPARFPAVSISFFTHDADLVPLTQDVIRGGSKRSGRSFWDLIVQPGRVWSEPGDGQWSRAAFPFALVNSLEGETHNGLATFLYRAGMVSNLRFQIVQQTAPFLVQEYFYAAGLVPARFESLGPQEAEVAALTRRYQTSLAQRVPIADWKDLAAKVGVGALAGFDGKMPVRDIVLAGLDYDGVFYLEECLSAAGPLPWCDRARFGVWSATKALADETALLRLAQKFGSSVFGLKLVDYLPELAGQAGWEGVRFEDAIDMATGVGMGSTKRSPNDISDGYLSADYQAWYQAPALDDKLRAVAASSGVYPWGPGQVARYRDQDMFLLGVAMDRFLKSKEGAASADLWSMLEQEVFEPIGIFYAPINRTIEPSGRGQPLMAFGYYPTVGDLVHIARLYQDGGRHGVTQILYAPRIAELTGGRVSLGLPTGEQLTFGETRYTNAFWVAPFQIGGCRIDYPRMVGWGGNIVALLPNGITGIRLAKSAATTRTADVETADMARVADHLKKYCD